MGPRDPTEHVRIEFPEVRISDAVGRAMGSVGEHGFQALAGAQGAVAHALDNLGSQIDKTGNQLWERAQGLQELQNQNALSKAELEFDKYVATKKAQFENNQGEAATEDTYKAYMKDLEEQQKKLGAILPPKTLEQFNRSTRNQIGRAGIAAAGHVASEIRKVTIGTSEARVNQWKDELSKTEDLDRTKELIDNIEKEIHGTQAPARGWAKPQADEAVRKHVGEGYIGQLKNLARTDPWQALKILDHPDNKGLWDDKQYTATKEHIIHEMTRLGARNIGNGVQTADPDAPLEKKLEEGDKKSEEEEKRTGQKLSDLKEATRHAIKERHHTHKEAVAEERRRNLETLDAVLDGRGENSGGNKPKNEDDLYAYGGDKARSAYEKLNDTDKKAVRRQLNRIALGLTDPTPESENIRQTLKGMSEEDPGAFRELDLNQFEDLRHADKVALEKLQEKYRKEGIKIEADPRVGRALSIAQAEGFIEKNLPSNKTKWYNFRGAFSDAIHTVQKEIGYDKYLTVDQIKEVVRMVEKKDQVDRSLFGIKWKGETEPLYQRLKEVPKETQEIIRKEHPGITDSEMLERYRRKAFQLEWREKFKATK
jgi:hypothetical protein